MPVAGAVVAERALAGGILDVADPDRFTCGGGGFRCELECLKRGPGVATRSLQIGAFEDSIINLDYSRGSTYMLLLWIIVFITARYLVSVLGKAQRRAAGAES